MDVNELDYELPPDLIAQHPVEPRDQSRLMVLDRRQRSWDHRTFADLPELLQPGDLLVRNDSKVLPARLIGRRDATGGKWEGLYLRSLPDGAWELLATTRGHPRIGETFSAGQGLKLVLERREAEGRWIARPLTEGAAESLLNEHGEIPLPPYIRKGREGPGDRERYQTAYARAAGSVAAPTAGLHFTAGLFERLRDRAIEWADVTLHVGVGTFRPIQVSRLEDHEMHAEEAELSPATADRLNQRKREGKRIIAVGTTTTRTLEHSARDSAFVPFRGPVDLFITPGYRFQGIDGLITNFHLPKSSLLALIGAFAGLDFVRDAYCEAVRLRYRFYSYGDAMLIL